VRVIAVIDLMAGQVVRAAQGNRAAYRAIASRLVAGASPEGIARALADKFRLADAYVADLDAIAGGEPDFESLALVAASGMRLWVDAGVSDPERARALWGFLNRERIAGRVIVGLESIADPLMLGELREAAGGESAVFSLDLKAGTPLSASGWDRVVAPAGSSHKGAALAIAAAAVAGGFRALIVLDLAQVGSSRGPSIGELCAAVRQQYPAIELIGGGGVRGASDLRMLAKCGCDAVLVATALHEGALTREEVAEMEWTGEGA
jgi:phosphoribosylformimino-5-aminoimidazole carboxamide ribotide isomerase